MPGDKRFFVAVHVIIADLSAFLTEELGWPGVK